MRHFLSNCGNPARPRSGLNPVIAMLGGGGGCVSLARTPDIAPYSLQTPAVIVAGMVVVVVMFAMLITLLDEGGSLVDVVGVPTCP